MMQTGQNAEMHTLADDQPLHDVQAYQESEERHQWIYFAIISTMLMAGGFVTFLYFYSKELRVDHKIFIGITASILALLLAFAYFFAFRFFDELFYLFVAIGWLANACYLPFEFLFESNCNLETNFNISKCVEFSLYTFAISFASSIAFYMSTLADPRQTLPSSARRSLYLWVGGTVAMTLLNIQLLKYLWPTSKEDFQFAAYTTPGALFAAYGLFWVGRYITRVLHQPKMESNWTMRLLSWSFYFYSVLQLSYPFKIYFVETRRDGIFLSLFIVAFVIKSVNVYCLVKVLLTVKYPEFVQAKAELATLQERLHQQSQLAALGAIAASIEHDMKTPLAGMSTKLEAMRLLYSDAKIKGYIEKLEADKNRIAAIAKIVPFMRGAEEFYDRDRFMNKVGVNEVASRAIKGVKVEMSLDPKKFFFPINPGLAPTKKNVTHFARAYSPMLEQMMVNLYKNGIEAIREAGKDGGAITTRIITTRTIPDKLITKQRLKKFAKWVKIEIEDNGCGIPEENIPLLTSLFTTKNDRKPNGGIGLFIARHLIRIHDGVMDISSVEGRGTTVSVYLPDWEAYRNYILGHPEAVIPGDDLANDIGALDAPVSEPQTPVIAE